MDAMQPGAEQQQAPQLHDVKIVRKKKYECARVVGVPPEEFGIGRNDRTIQDAGYCFHEVLRRQADLISEGYDEEQIKGLPSYTINTTIETTSRDTVEESTVGGGDDGINKANRQIKITEHYVRMDYEGNGKACLYRVTTGGDQGEVLKRNGKEEIVKEDMAPFAAMTPFIVTHRFFGKSVADFVMDIMRIKTALVRGLLDNTYLALNPRNEVAEEGANENTLDDLLISRPGGIVRVKRSGTVTPLVHPDISAGIYPAIQYMDATREWRTGVTRQGSGLDANALQNQTATSANQLFTAAQARIKLIARIFAETGIRDLFSLLHGTIRKNGSVAQTVRLRNQWVQVDPRDWKTRNDMTVTVGLGSGGKEQQLVGAQLLIGAQEKAIAAGMVSPKNLYNSAKMLTKLLGHKDVDEFFTMPGQPQDPNKPQDPASQPIPPPQDPKMMELQAKNEIEKTQAQADIATTDRKTNAEIARDDRKAKQQMDLALLEHDLKMTEMKADSDRKREQHQQSMQQKTVDHNARAQERQDKAAEAGQPKASIEVKHGADEITGPLADVVNQLGQHLSNSQAQQMNALMAVVEGNKRPKRIKGPSGKVYEIEG